MGNNNKTTMRKYRQEEYNDKEQHQFSPPSSEPGHPAVLSVAELQEAASRGLQLTMDYFTALKRRDMDAMADTLHFPFTMYEDTEPRVYKSRREFLNNRPPYLIPTGSLEPDQNTPLSESYDLLESVDAQRYSPLGGMFTLRFRRYTAEGHSVMDCDVLLSVANNDGHWAIQLVSAVPRKRIRPE